MIGQLHNIIDRLYRSLLGSGSLRNFAIMANWWSDALVSQQCRLSTHYRFILSIFIGIYRLKRGFWQI